MNENHSEHSQRHGENNCQHIHGHEDHGSAATVPAGKYTCPMHPEVVSDKPGDCPKCGMALEPMAFALPKTIYTCPMHPEVEQDHPGDCPKCGMALEPKTFSAATEEDDSELVDMTRRLWIGAILTLPLLILVMVHMVPRWSHLEWV